MTEQEWLSSEDPSRMLFALTSEAPGPRQGRARPSDRKLRLFVAAGLAVVLPESTLRPQVEAMADDPSIPPDRRWWPTDADPADGARCVATATRRPGSMKRLAALLRDIVGNPFRPVTLPPAEHSWFDGTEIRTTPVLSRHRFATPAVLSLARAAYEEREGHWERTPLRGISTQKWVDHGTLDGARLAVLSDALEEAGCDSADLLSHLRSPGPHVRGMWSLDLILGRE
jgi:hypothetical protein